MTTRGARAMALALVGGLLTAAPLPAAEPAGPAPVLWACDKPFVFDRTWRERGPGGSIGLFPS